MALGLSATTAPDKKLWGEFRNWIHRQNEGREWDDVYTVSEALRDAMQCLMWRETDGFPTEEFLNRADNEEKP